MSSDWLDERLLAFNLLPSLTLHASRYPDFLGPEAEQIAAAGTALSPMTWHRHWSAAILQQLDLTRDLVLDIHLPQLALALLPPDRLLDCQQKIGVALCGQRLRQTIAGDEVRALLNDPGQALLDFARHDGSAPHARLPASNSQTLAPTREQLRTLGSAALMQALGGGPRALTARVRLKLPATTPAGTTEIPITPDEALALGLNILQVTDPTWLSSFPAAR